MERRPGTPSLLRELNDRAALELLLAGGPMTRAQLGEHTGLSKVTASQLLARLEERGLVQVAGEQAGGRGPNAALYGVVPSAAYVAGLHVDHTVVSAGVADVTGRELAVVSVDPNAGHDPVELVRGAVAAAAGSAGVSPDALRSLVIGTPGVLDPHRDTTQYLRAVANEGTSYVTCRYVVALMWAALRGNIAISEKTPCDQSLVSMFITPCSI